MEALIFPIIYILFIGFIVVKTVSQKIQRDNSIFDEFTIEEDIPYESLVDSHNIEHDMKILDQERKVARFSEFNRDYKTMADLHNVEHDQKIMDQKNKVATYSEGRNNDILDDEEIVTKTVNNLQEDVLRGLIFAEIMSKPKALRKH